MIFFRVFRPMPRLEVELNFQIRYPAFCSSVWTTPRNCHCHIHCHIPIFPSSSTAATLWLVWQWIFMARLLRQQHPRARGVAPRGSGAVFPSLKVWIWWSGTLQGETWLRAKQTYSWRDYARPPSKLHLKICMAGGGNA